MALPLLALLIFSIPSDATQQYCNFKYKIYDPAGKSFVCSVVEISKTDIQNIDNKIVKFIELYPKFISFYGYKWDYSGLNLAVLIVTEDYINNEINFGIKENSGKTILARYFPDSHIMYISPKSMKEKDLDIPHELSHVANNDLGIISQNTDESIAYDFERYYVAQ